MCMHELKGRLYRALPIDFQKREVWEQKQLTKVHWCKPTALTYEIPLPCGYCLECVLEKAKQWSIKCSAEAKMHSKKCFVTLSYNNEHLPHTEEGLNTLKIKDLQDFFKRLLKHNPECKIRRFWSAEYGYTGTRASNGGNPHYHCVIFGYVPNDLVPRKYHKDGDYWDYKSKSLMKIWGKGFVVVSEVTPESAGYTARYTMKKAGIKPQKRGKYPNPKFNPWYERTSKENKGINKYCYIDCINLFNGVNDFREKERTNSSRRPGIGKPYWNEYFEQLTKQEGFYVKTMKGIKLLPLAKTWLQDWKNIHKNSKPKFNLKKMTIQEYNALMLAYRLDKPRREELLDKYYKYVYKLQLDAVNREKEELKQHKGLTLEEIKKMKYEALEQRIRALKRNEEFYQQLF